MLRREDLRQAIRRKFMGTCYDLCFKYHLSGRKSLCWGEKTYAKQLDGNSWARATICASKDFFNNIVEKSFWGSTHQSRYCWFVSENKTHGIYRSLWNLLLVIYDLGFFCSSKVRTIYTFLSFSFSFRWYAMIVFPLHVQERDHVKTLQFDCVGVT